MIKQLSNQSISQIATGSTLQSLKNFVKEVIENSLDAQTTSLSITFFDYGRDGFQLVDNGVGIKIKDQQNLGVRGGTSKLEIFEDLESIQTHGFRGEALNAIGKLSNLAIISKHEDDEIGWKWDLMSDPTPFPRERGTTIIVKDLFYSLPVRKEDFQKNYKSQYNQTINNITEYALINTQVEFKIWNLDKEKGKQEVLSSGQATTLFDRIRYMLGESVAQELLPFTANIDEQTSMNGFLSKNVDSGSSRGTLKKLMWYTFINAKPVNMPKSLLKVITEKYRQHNPNGKFVFILHIHINRKGDIDFNVSVDKRDVYLRQEKMIVKVLEEVIQNRLEMSKEDIKTLTQSKLTKNTQEQLKQSQQSQQSEQDQVQNKTKRMSEAIEKRKDNSIAQVKTEKRKSNFLSGLNNQLKGQINQSNVQPKLQQQQQQQQQKHQMQEEINEDCCQQQQQQQQQQQNQYQEQQDQQQQEQQKQELQQSQFQEIQINDEELKNNTKIVEEIEHINFTKTDFENLEVIGQFNQGFMICKNKDKIFVLDQHACDEKRLYEHLQKTYKLNRVKLMKPIKFNLPSYYIDIIKQHKQKLDTQFYYKIEIEDQNSVSLITIPEYWKYTFGKDTLIAILDDIEDCKQIPGIKQILASQACRSSVMIGTALQKHQMQQLVKQMSELDSPWNCPHGRPTLINIKQPNIQKFEKGFSQNI